MSRCSMDTIYAEKVQDLVQGEGISMVDC